MQTTMTKTTTGTFDKKDLRIITDSGLYGYSYDSAIRPEYLFDGQKVEGIALASTFVVQKKLINNK